MTLTDADLGLLGAYLEGSLENEQELFRFEERLARDPELAAAFDASVRADTLARMLARAKRARHARATPSRPWLRRPGLYAGLAAAAGILALLYFRPWAPGVRVSVIATGVALEENNRELGLRGEDVNKVPLGTLRGSDPDSSLVEIPLDEYMALVGPLQEQRLREALDGSYELADAEFFVIGVRTAEPCSAVVLLLDGGGRVVGAKGESGHIAWPAEQPWTPATGRLASPGDHLLPRPSILRTAGLDYDPGFLVPIGSGKVTVLIGSRVAPLDARAEQELRAAMQAAGGSGLEDAQDRLSSCLEALGFKVDVKIVRERNSENR